MTEPIKIQLAIQGGGAKIVALVAALEAIQLLEEQSVIKVTRICGTSAGAIVGCLYGAGIRMDKVKIYLQQDLGRELVRRFVQPTRRAIVWGILRGRPFWKTRVLEKWLRKRFREQRKTKLNELDPPVTVIASDLGNSAIRIFEGNDPIVSSIMDSCGLPYYFRMWNNAGGPVYVDGGLCENLPVRELERYEAEGYGTTVALTFDPIVPGPPQDILDFSKALVDTAINNSIERAKMSLNPQCIHTIETAIGTFDFTQAISGGLGDSYDLVKERADRWFREFVNKRKKGQREVVGDPWREPNLIATELMKNVNQVYLAQHLYSRVRYKECTCEVQLNSLLDVFDERFGDPDVVKYSETFEPIDEPIHCLRVRLAESSDPEVDIYLGRTFWVVRNAEKEIVRSIGVPASDPLNPKARYILIFFDPVLRPNNGEYSLYFQDEAKSMVSALIREGKDDIEFTPKRAGGTVGRINLVLHVPIGRRDLKMSSQPNRPLGRQMNEKELGYYITPPRFYTLGWTGTELDAESVKNGFGVDVIANS